MKTYIMCIIAQQTMSIGLSTWHIWTKISRKKLTKTYEDTKKSNLKYLSNFVWSKERRNKYSIEKG